MPQLLDDADFDPSTIRLARLCVARHDPTVSGEEFVELACALVKQSIREYVALNPHELGEHPPDVTAFPDDDDVDNPTGKQTIEEIAAGAEPAEFIAGAPIAAATSEGDEAGEHFAVNVVEIPAGPKRSGWRHPLTYDDRTRIRQRYQDAKQPNGRVPRGFVAGLAIEYAVPAHIIIDIGRNRDSFNENATKGERSK